MYRSGPFAAVLPGWLNSGHFDAIQGAATAAKISQTTRGWEASMGRRYQSIVETIGNTPVVRINRLAPKGVNVFAKIEAFNPLGSVKDRLALGVIEGAEKSGALKPRQRVKRAQEGKTGIGLAMVCAAKGYPLVITMAEPFSVERRKL